MIHDSSIEFPMVVVHRSLADLSCKKLATRTIDIALSPTAAFYFSSSALTGVVDVEFYCVASALLCIVAGLLLFIVSLTREL